LSFTPGPNFWGANPNFTGKVKDPAQSLFGWLDSLDLRKRADRVFDGWNRQIGFQTVVLTKAR
jgi:hypothetical protein